MKQLRSYSDERILAFCAFCGGETGTRDHCPSLVFLDKPYPDNLSVVPACSTCNKSFSADEEYLACLISCIIVGSTNPEVMPRKKTKRILSDKPFLRARIKQAKSISGGNVIFKPEYERVAKVITKLAQGHAFYEFHESCARTPDEINIIPLSLMNTTRRVVFENPEPCAIWPEVGSRAMQRFLTGADLTTNNWIIVQQGRYRFHPLVDNGIHIRIVINEYLSCYVHWGENKN